MNEILSKIETSFKAANKGTESLSCLIYWWGIIGYLVAYFIADRIIKINEVRFVDVAVSSLMIVYFAWHFYALKKCSPKKIKLSKEEKKLQKAQARAELGKKFMRKLLLQEPITKWDPVFIEMVIDVFSIANFASYIVR